MERKIILKNFGKNVKIARIRQDLTQENLAEIMNVSQNYVASIEEGRANMSLVKICELAGILNIEVTSLLENIIRTRS